MKKTLHFSVRTPEGSVLKKDVISFKIATDEKGLMVVLPHHATLTGSVTFSRLWVRTPEAEHEYLVQQGFLFISVTTNSAQLLCYSCKELKDIEYKTAQQYLEFLERKLKEGADLNAYQLKFLHHEKIAMVQQISFLEKNGKGERQSP